MLAVDMLLMLDSSPGDTEDMLIILLGELVALDIEILEAESGGDSVDTVGDDCELDSEAPPVGRMLLENGSVGSMGAVGILVEASADVLVVASVVGGPKLGLGCLVRRTCSRHA